MPRFRGSLPHESDTIRRTSRRSIVLDPRFSDQLTKGDAPAPGGDAAHLRRCPGCQADLDGVPNAAKFCPRCGTDLHHANDAVNSTPASTSPLPADAFAGTNAADPTRPVLPPIAVRTPILRGFASALYRLGRRYEGGLGSRYNPAEAERCYFKAAKLGNPAALARLHRSADGDELSSPGSGEPLGPSSDGAAPLID